MNPTRRDFEAWWTRDKSGDVLEQRLLMLRESIDPDGEYSVLRVQTAWEAWEASLNASRKIFAYELADAGFFDAGKHLLNDIEK